MFPRFAYITYQTLYNLWVNSIQTCVIQLTIAYVNTKSIYRVWYKKYIKPYVKSPNATTNDIDTAGTRSMYIPTIGTINRTVGYTNDGNQLKKYAYYTKPNVSGGNGPTNPCVVDSAFLSVDFCHASMAEPISLTIPPEYYCNDSNIFTLHFVHQLLHLNAKSNTDQKFIRAIQLCLDRDYRLEIMDTMVNCFELSPMQFIKITGNEQYIVVDI